MTSTNRIMGYPPLPPQRDSSTPRPPSSVTPKETPSTRNAEGLPRPHLGQPQGMTHLRRGPPVPRVIRQVRAAGLGEQDTEQPPQHGGAPEDGHGDGAVVVGQEADQRGQDPGHPRRHGAQPHARLPVGAGGVGRARRPQGGLLPRSPRHREGPVCGESSPDDGGEELGSVDIGGGEGG